MACDMITIENLRFNYPRSNFELRIADLTVGAGEKVAFIGPSGSGKTTLLNLIAGIYKPQTGSCSVNGQPVDRLADRERRDFRISKIGMVFQQFELLEYLNTEDNILLPYLINKSLQLNNETRQRARELAAQMGIGDKLKRYPHQLSQGEQQRVAICRALINGPSLILADEPTGNLDPANKRKILDLLFQQSESQGQTLVVVTHDLGILDGFDRTIDFEKFRVESSVEVAQ
jgi:putative ABC transport system ATP-binding protein